MNLPYDMYASGDYLKENPSWHSEDSPWKAGKIREILQACKVTPSSICEVGCGSGNILAELRRFYPQAELFGYDIAPDATRFWSAPERDSITFQLGDFFVLNKINYDVILLIDVIEHVADPITFLSSFRGKAKYYLLHIPLDLSASTVLREKPLLEVRKAVGHIHYFTKNLALSLMGECGYKVVEWRYSGAAFNALAWKQRLASIPRRIAYTLNKDWGVRALGGETLFVLAQDKD